MTVEIVTSLKARAQAGETVFYDIYTEAEKAANPDERDRGLFFFEGEPGARFAVCSEADAWRPGWELTAQRPSGG